MNTNVESDSSRLDAAKLLLAVALIVGAVAGYYYWAEHSHLLRVLALLSAIVMAALIALQTTIGRTTWSFFREARNEVRKVVWPTRKETVQTTMMVVVMVILIAIFLWILDMFLGWGVGSLTGQRA